MKRDWRFISFKSRISLEVDRNSSLIYTEIDEKTL